MGHALNDTVQDVLTRYHRMLGENACWLVGTDHAGIATQNVVEKMLRKEGLTKEDLGREEFVSRVWEWRREYGGTIIEQLKRIGCSCDYERERFTFDDGYAHAVTKVFVALYEKGYIHKDSYLVNWCPRCGTAISDLEVAYRDMPGTLNHIRYDVVGGGSVTIATTRPETMLGDTAVAVHPDDERYKDVVGKTAILPLLGRELKIVADERVDPAFGTGALKITPAHDLTDFDIGRTHGLEAVQAIGQDGRITEAGGPYAGLEVEEAAERVTSDLRALGALVKVEDYPHSVATCDRCGTPIEPLISEQWFMDMDELKKPATDVVRDGKVKFTPERWGRVYIDWMDNLRPWCISRQLWWGHQLPVWYCPDGHLTVAETEPQACAQCGSTELTRETDVLDTWFSSALWPFATFGWPEQTADLAYFYPTNVLSTGRDIIFLWVARMIMMGLEFMDDIPFDDVYLHSVIQASDGRRMSKSLGTGIDPLEMIDAHGADATRFGLLLMSSTQDVRFSEEKIAMGRGFANKLWNAARFVLLGSEGYAAERSDAARGGPLDHEPLPALPGHGRGGGDRLRLHRRRGHALPLRVGRVLRLVPGARQGPAVRRGRGEEGAGRGPRALDARPDRAPAAPLHAVRHRGDRRAVRRGAAARAASTRAGTRRNWRRTTRRPSASCRRPSTRCGASAPRRRSRRARCSRRSSWATAPARRRTTRATPASSALWRAPTSPSRANPSADATVVLVPGGRLEVAAAVDRAEEIARLEQQLAKAEAEVQRGEAKLGNEKFVGRAPEAVVAKEREKLAGHVAERDGLAARLAQLRGA